ncbi:hypothetical protein OG894_28785 [Streptomyces sp. NBC_01724]|uniref:hypothetical protein n=1 Tax=unclassified Streptomyces TaxID=2593676 RepID=UPI002E2FB814|nr:hypothetical protein [Streptomyces sp. NBC_01724]WTE59728.1 hypothetical protein OG784_13530 [Streptomyces sp. NBC_01617]
MWDYAKLSAEAAKRGGPAALRAAYRLAGRQQGIKIGQMVGRGQGVIFGAGVGVGGTMLYNSLRTRRTGGAPEPTPESSVETPGPGAGTDA